MNAALSPIPEISPVAGWKEVPIRECGEPLVAIGPFSKYSNELIFTDSVYFGERQSSPYQREELEGAILGQYVRQGVAERLVQASRNLPERCALMVWDAYRPLSVQGALYKDFQGQLVRYGLTEEDATVEAQRFVSIPSTDPTRPSPHNTGASVDLTIVRFSEKAWADLKGPFFSGCRFRVVYFLTPQSVSVQGSS